MRHGNITEGFCGASIARETFTLSRSCSKAIPKLRFVRTSAQCAS